MSFRLSLLFILFLPVVDGIFFRSLVNWWRKRHRFQIELAFLGVPEEDQTKYFAAARDRWERVIRGDIPRLFINESPDGDCGTLPLFVDDMYMCFKYEELDGSLKIIGSASIGIMRSGKRKGELPATGDIVLDIDDVDWIKEQGVLEKLIIHESGHLLGIGIRWLSLGLTGYEEDGCPYDLDTAASREYQDISGCTGQSVPVETDFGRGTRCKHWDEACMLGEVMTGKLSNTTAEDLKLSRMTIGTLEDIGYEVDYEAADDYTAADMNETCVCNGQGRRLVKDKTTQRRRQLSEAGRRQAEAYGQSVLQSRKGKRERYQFSMSQARYVGHESIRVFFVEDEEIFAVDVLAASG